MNTNEVLDNEITTERRNPVTKKSVIGLIAAVILALVLCAPYAKVPGSGAPAKAPVAAEAVVDAAAGDSAM